eukprot:CAMPEP_0181315336 /NCGR_PEP_ID=MMETSP1101-20121128/15320_1 /TAXON_ID=46948 /ORGANISM="Rhodomonas abbreviata, Strain Caron Lab Isolate" /LENGTH=177 /DNA_ID=CAMNT_0023422535 /DNA_START=128 /DNA_END=661 /DNA_ORIENTATION=+
MEGAGEEEPTVWAAKQLEAHKKRKAEREKREMRTFEKILRQKEQGVKLTGEAEEWFTKKAALDPEASSRVAVRQMAQKSLNSDNWAGELMKGSSQKFSSVGKNTVENRLVSQVTGLVTYDDYKRKKQDLQEQEEAGALGAVDNAEEEQGAKKAAKRSKKDKPKGGVLSFDADAEEEP